MRRLRERLEGSGTLTTFALAAVLCMPGAQLAAQQPPDSTRAGQPPVVTGGAPKPVPTIAPQPPASAAPASINMRGKAPLSAKRAFLYSALLPGLGQSRLDRGSSGALFASVELAAMVMLRRSAADVREARRYLVDTLPERFTVNVTGTEIRLVPAGTVTGIYTNDLVRARRLHAEDWIAVIAFNHLFSGADAFVSAQLWDMPVQLTATPSAQGPLFVVTVRF